MSPDDTVENKKAVSLIEIGKKFAVLVGINEYGDSSINPLNFSVKDIQDFYDVLVDPEKGKYVENNVKVLSDTNEERPARNNILSKLTTMSRSANPEDSILFYFSGHGAEIGGKPYLLCSDSYRNTIEQTTLSNELIRKVMESSLARVKIIILDACHSGVLKGVKDSGIMTKSFFESFFPPPEGFVALASCKLGECSHEWAEKEHGVFSYYLLEGLEGSADRDGDKIITITDAYNYTSENVRRWAFKKGLEQNPTFRATLSGDIPFVHVEKIIEEEERIDKSIISGIALVNLPITDEDRRNNLVENMCGSLLQFAKANEIKRTSFGRIEFPYGLISPLEGQLGDERSYYTRVYFIYVKDEWKKIDEVIRYFDEKYYWHSVEYKITKRINIQRIVEKCKENFEIISFKPEKGKESITVDTETWLNTLTVFRNQDDNAHSEIIIYAPGRYTLPRNFYSTLSPENIVEFIKDCLE